MDLSPGLCFSLAGAQPRTQSTGFGAEGWGQAGALDTEALGK